MWPLLKRLDFSGKIGGVANYTALDIPNFSSKDENYTATLETY